MSLWKRTASKRRRSAPKNGGGIMVKDFACSRCGACCRQLPLFHGIYDDLDRGDGVCRHFDEQTDLCGIYECRPEMCNVRHSYALFKQHLSWESYVERTTLGCKFLRAQLRKTPLK